MTVGTFTLVKNEARWIRAHLLSWLPHVDEMVLFDGNSTDGTLEIVREVRKSHACGHKVTLVEDRDCADLREDYVRVFNACLRTLTTDYAVFAHPDMVLVDPGRLNALGACHAYTTSLRSFGGEPDGPLYELVGRGERWKNVYRLRQPDLGLHYAGWYGAAEEDCYFSKITGSVHKHYGQDFARYPYTVGDSGVQVLHYSDVRPAARRLDRMVRCLVNQGMPEVAARAIAAAHPRVTLQSGQGLELVPAEYHPLLQEVPA